MLVLTQAGIGGMFAEFGVAEPRYRLIYSVLFAAGLACSVLHLGQPKKAWRVWLGWRTSWLSREAVMLNVLAACLGLQLAGVSPPLLVMGYLGSSALFCEAMVYADTRRKFWALRQTLPKFLGTALVLGAAVKLATAPCATAAWILLAATLLKLAWEIGITKHTNEEAPPQLQRTARLQTGLLRPAFALRILLGLLGGVFLPFVMIAGTFSPAISISAAVASLVAELVERYLFFTSVAPEKMPGNIGA
jgi:DMSO reductase anchor subunit